MPSLSYLLPFAVAASASFRFASRRSPATPRAALLASAAPDAAAERDRLLFDSLLASHAVTASVRLAGGAFHPRGRTLLAAADLSAGAALLRVPAALLLTAHRSGACAGLHGQTELLWAEVGDLREEAGEAAFRRGMTWDVRLALALLDATAGAGGEFWLRYRALLPPPAAVSHPLCLPPPLRAELRDAAVAAAAEARARLLHSLAPGLRAHGCHPATAAYEALGAPAELVPRPLEYAYALVASRCFATADEHTFAFVPFADLCQHAARPNANFSSEDGGFVLRALRAIGEGEEVTICYGEEYSSSRFFAQYGFAPEEGCAKDSAMLQALVPEADAAGDERVAAARAAEPRTPLGASPLGMQALMRVFDEMKECEYASEPRFAAILEALLAEDGPSPHVLLAAVTWRLEQLDCSARELDEGIEELQQQQPLDLRTIAVLSYRAVVAKQLELTQRVLSKLLND
ncbi:hypothetical protein AB1Y20_010833 [Prymnesium parvum]|uniref:SET domain-containing protein n=1 Tax=Prymnesium parvum TaxID=97485 RepID=A0AB34IQU2_PRYPA